MSYQILLGDCLDTMRTLPDGCVQTCVTSPPYYGLRDYGVDEQIGLEETPEAYVAKLVEVFREVRRILRDDGTVWLNLGDSYATGTTAARQDGRRGLGEATQKAQDAVPRIGNPLGCKTKDLIGIPWMVAFALRADGWYLRSAITWCKGNPMPESVSGSRFIRHRVTIEEYEKLSSLRETERGNLDRASNLSSLSAREGVRGETSLSAEREGASNGAGKGTARGREREAATSQPIRARATEQSQVRVNGKGQGDTEESPAQISYQRQGQTEGRGAPSGNQRHAFAGGAEATGESALHAFREMEGEETPGLRTAQSSNSARTSSDSRGLAGNLQTAQEPLLLLQEAEGVDAGSCDPHQQGRIACEGEHSASLSELQLEEEGQSDSSLLVDCPGCPKCEKHGGYILSLSAGRPTKATEQIFLLSKSPSYFYDSNAILTDTGANRRDWWAVNTRPYANAHFATFPEALIEPCILAGTSARGCCAKCGAPWAREIEMGEPSKETTRGQQEWTKVTGQRDSAGGLPIRTSTTLGWAATCECNADIVPCTVLDPFSGSGTTGAVALRHGRQYIGCELNADYIELAHRRIQQSQPMLLELS